MAVWQRFAFFLTLLVFVVVVIVILTTQLPEANVPFALGAFAVVMVNLLVFGALQDLIFGKSDK